MRVKADIMVGDYYYATFVGEVESHKDIVCGEVTEVVSQSDIEKAVVARYPSLKKKDYRVIPL